MNGFDRSILVGLNHYARRVEWVDELAVLLNRSALFKGGVIMGLLWWQWFVPRAALRQVRSILLTALAGGFLALVVGRALALLLPFRTRPLHNPSLGFVIPYGSGPGDFQGWSSFPSDHAMMYFAIAVGLCFVSRRAGAFALAWTFVAICLPRIYAGQHHPTDILAGALVGTGIATLVQRGRIRDRMTAPLLEWSDRHPAAVYAALFLLTFMISNMFSDLREVLRIGLSAVHHARG